MVGPVWFEFMLAVVGAVSVAIQFKTGRIDLLSDLEEYRHATRQNDPGRYWAFIIGMSIVTAALFGEAIYRSNG